MQVGSIVQLVTGTDKTYFITENKIYYGNKEISLIMMQHDNSALQ